MSFLYIYVGIHLVHLCYLILYNDFYLSLSLSLNHTFITCIWPARDGNIIHRCCNRQQKKKLSLYYLRPLSMPQPHATVLRMQKWRFGRANKNLQTKHMQPGSKKIVATMRDCYQCHLHCIALRCVLSWIVKETTWSDSIFPRRFRHVQIKVFGNRKKGIVFSLV